MKNYILLLGILLLISCKTKEDYSKYTFIDDNLKSNNYEIVSLMSEKYQIKNMLGYTLTRGMFSPEQEKKTWDMPLIYFNKKNMIFFIIYDRDNSIAYYMKYDCLTNKKDTINNEDSIQRYKKIFEDNYKKKNDLVDFKFPEAEKYYKTKSELKDTISKENIKIIYEKYPDNENKRNQMKNLMSIYYKTDFINLHMPNENIKFKYNLLGNGKIIFFGTEELYKKGYIFIYIYNISNIFPHSGGLYVIRPKTKK
ncbi:hypothetical protein [Apibacter adventoris]|uniref:hypothetical protein n=1 Tax=Apibacter adventoris TaxID=1679466 RepID=UPI000CF6373F|nr:hypothetical protein [Apibacter adventoris]PQL94142.1 hypothetical protein C4S76_06335 [Apibacter adventoris]